MLKGLAYAGITSPAGDAWAVDGPEKYGFKRAPNGPDGAVRLRLDEYQYRIAIHPGETGALAYLGWDVGGPAEFAAARERLESLGLTLHHGTSALREERCVGDLTWFRSAWVPP